MGGVPDAAHAERLADVVGRDHPTGAHRQDHRPDPYPPGRATLRLGRAGWCRCTTNGRSSKDDSANTPSSATRPGSPTTPTGSCSTTTSASAPTRCRAARPSARACCPSGRQASPGHRPHRHRRQARRPGRDHRHDPPQGQARCRPPRDRATALIPAAGYVAHRRRWPHLRPHGGYGMDRTRFDATTGPEPGPAMGSYSQPGPPRCDDVGPSPGTPPTKQSPAPMLPPQKRTTALSHPKGSSGRSHETSRLGTLAASAVDAPVLSGVVLNRRAPGTQRRAVDVQAKQVRASVVVDGVSDRPVAR